MADITRRRKGGLHIDLRRDLNKSHTATSTQGDPQNLIVCAGRRGKASVLTTRLRSPVTSPTHGLLLPQASTEQDHDCTSTLVSDEGKSLSGAVDDLLSRPPRNHPRRTDKCPRLPEQELRQRRRTATHGRKCSTNNSLFRGIGDWSETFANASGFVQTRIGQNFASP